MQVPFISYAKDIIGVGGSNIDNVRCTSGANLTIKEIRCVLDEIAVEIKESPYEVYMAAQLNQDFISNHKEPASIVYEKIDSRISNVYWQLSDTGYPSSWFCLHIGSSSLGGYGSPGGGGYNIYRYCLCLKLNYYRL